MADATSNLQTAASALAASAFCCLGLLLPLVLYELIIPLVKHLLRHPPFQACFGIASMPLEFNAPRIDKNLWNSKPFAICFRRILFLAAGSEILLPCEDGGQLMGLLVSIAARERSTIFIWYRKSS